MARALRRRAYLIDKRLQLRFTGLVVALVVVYSLFLGAATYMNYRISCIVFDNTAYYDPAVEKSIEAGGRRMMVTTVLFLVVNGIVIGVVFVLLTHKVAGPLYRIRRHLAEIQNGRLPGKMVLRKGDELGHMAESINQMTEALRTSAQQEARELEAVVVALGEVLAEVNREGQTSIGNKIEQVMRRVEALKAVRQRLLCS